MAPPTTITIELNLDDHLARHLGYDEDGEHVQGPMTVEDLVLGLVAQKLVRNVVDRAAGKGRDGWYDSLGRKVAEIRDTLIAEQLEPLVREALEGEYRATNGFGEPVGQPTTLRSVIAKQVDDWLNSRDGDTYRNPKRLTRLSALVAEQVDKAMTKELSAAVADAKAQVVAAVKAKGAEVLAKTIADMAKGQG